MADMNEEDIFDLSDEELEAAFKEAKAAEASPDTDMENNIDASTDNVVNQDEEQTYEESFEDDDAEVDDNTEVDTSTDDDSKEKEINNDPEQPDAESDHDAGEKTKVDSNPEEETDTTDDDTSDEKPDSDESDTTKENEEAKDDSQQVQTYKFKANGQEYEFNEKEIMEQFPRIFGQAMDYTKKMQSIKPWRKTIDAIEQAELKHDDINLMIDVLRGDKDAVAEVLKRTGVDALDLDAENSNYVAKDYGRDESALAIKDVVDTISKDEAYPTTHNILSKQWDDASWAEMSQDPELIRLLHVDVQSGMYDTISPIANKLKVYDGGRKSDLEYYKEAAQQHFGELDKLEAQKAMQEQQEAREASIRAEAEAKAKAEAEAAEQARLEKVKAEAAEREAAKKASSKRKAAATTKSNAGSRDVVNYLDDSDEAFEEWYKNLQESM